mgnify:FL=1
MIVDSAEGHRTIRIRPSRSIWRTLRTIAVMGAIVCCLPIGNIADVQLEAQEEHISARHASVYMATLTTSFSPDDGPVAQWYGVRVDEVELVSLNSSIDADFFSPIIVSTITLLQPDGSDGSTYVEEWSLSSLTEEGDTGALFEPARNGLHLSARDSGSTPREIDVRIEFATTLQTPVHFRWTPSAYVRFDYHGCFGGKDGWVDLALQPQTSDTGEVVRDSDTGWY